MGLGKSLGLSLVIFVALNFVMQILYAVALGTIDVYFTNIGSDIVNFIVGLFMVNINVIIYVEPFLIDPGSAVLVGLDLGISLFSSDIFLAIVTIASPIVPPLIAAIVAGKMAESPGKAALGWLLTMIICAVVPMVLALLDLYTGLGLTYVVGYAGAVDNIVGIIVYTLIFALFNGMFWGVLSAILGKED